MIVLLLFYLFFPAVILYSCRKFSWLDKIGSVMLAYTAGLLIGNLGLFPTLSPEIHELLTLDAQQVKEEASTYVDSGTWTSKDHAAFSIYQLQDTLMSASILLALPLLLFSTNYKSICRFGKVYHSFSWHCSSCSQCNGGIWIFRFQGSIWRSVVEDKRNAGWCLHRRYTQFSFFKNDVGCGTCYLYFDPQL